jgi:hypothetical protein
MAGIKRPFIAGYFAVYVQRAGPLQYLCADPHCYVKRKYDGWTLKATEMA